MAVRGGKATLAHVTLVNNSAGHEGGGILKHAWEQLILRNSILADNQSEDCHASVSLDENIGNLIQDGTCDPILSGDPKFRLEDGVPTFISLDSDSPAIDAAHPDYCTEVDIRGIARPQGDACDIGAVEMLADEDTES